MKKIILTILLISLTGCSGGFGAGEITSVDLKEFKEVKIIETKTGDKYKHVFRNNTTGELKEITITEKDYSDLGKVNADQPALKGYTWEYSAKQDIISVEEPVLKEGEYIVIAQKTTTTPEIIKIKTDGIETVIGK